MNMSTLASAMALPYFPQPSPQEREHPLSAAARERAK